MSYKIYKKENHLGMLGKKHSDESNFKNRASFATLVTQKQIQKTNQNIILIYLLT
jgi:hypothetical protein